MKYSVLLLYPDYMSCPHGIETYFSHVEASDPKEAVSLAQEEAGEANQDRGAAGDFHPLLCVLGHHDDVRPV